MSTIKIYFSDFFEVSEDKIEEYGAVNISLINDLPLFIDPFLLFNSKDKRLNAIHDEMISYLKFLQIQSTKYETLEVGMMNAWYVFPEVKQTWLGFSRTGNKGRGNRKEFALNLHKGLSSIFSSFGNETITKAAHMEKLCLIGSKIGRDKISDFTTNFVKKYLLEYTEEFAHEFINPSFCDYFMVPKVTFNYETQIWEPKEYYLPVHKGDFVLLTPKSILTRDETFINRSDMIRDLQIIAPSIEDATLRFELNNYLSNIITVGDGAATKCEIDKATEILIRTHPEIIDYYVRYKENHEEEATSISGEHVAEAKTLFQNQLEELVNVLKRETGFYETFPDAYDECMKRVQFLKHVIEDKDGYRYFYVKDKPVRRESDLQIMFRLTWFGSTLDDNREVNNGRGPVDYKVSAGKKNAVLVEFKLVSNNKLKQNLENQVEIYKKASDTDRAIKVIMYFTAKEHDMVINVLNELDLNDCPDIVLIDARNDNKPSASNAKSNC